MGERGKEVFSEERNWEVEAVRLGLIVPENSTVMKKIIVVEP